MSKSSRNKLIDLTGQKLGGFFVVKRAFNKKGSESRWECLCDCGETVIVRGSRLRGGQKYCKKCQPKDNNVTHGLHGHPSYTTWVMMKQRCENPNATGYHNYGALGVKVCDRWQDFKLFVEDVGVPPSKKHTLDRYPNKEGDYEPNNWRWATAKEQLRNTRVNKILFFNGCNKSVSEWAETLGIKPCTIFNRLELGWSVEKALSENVRQTKRIIEYNGQSLTLNEWGEKLNINKDTLNSRIYKGWPLEKVFNSNKYK